MHAFATFLGYVIYLGPALIIPIIAVLHTRRAARRLGLQAGVQTTAVLRQILRWGFVVLVIWLVIVAGLYASSQRGNVGFLLVLSPWFFALGEGIGLWLRSKQ